MQMITLGAGRRDDRCAVMAAASAGHDVVAEARTSQAFSERSGSGRRAQPGGREAVGNQLFADPVSGWPAEAVPSVIGVTRTFGPDAGRSALPIVLTASHKMHLQSPSRVTTRACNRAGVTA